MKIKKVLFCLFFGGGGAKVVFFGAFVLCIFCNN